MSRHLWVRRCCALVVAVVAAYASFEHQRRFALAGGADAVSAALWPLSVDGLVVLSSIGLLTTRPDATARARWSVRLAFLLGVLVSLVANIAAAPVLAWQPIVVAGWPPVALLLSVELLALRAPVSVGTRASGETAAETESGGPESEVGSEVESERRTDEASLREVDRTRGESVARPNTARPRIPTRAEDVMWVAYQRAQSEGREPTGAELDRAAGTNNYGRAVLSRWRRTGRISRSGHRTDAAGGGLCAGVSAEGRRS